MMRPTWSLGASVVVALLLLAIASVRGGPAPLARENMGSSTSIPAFSRLYRTSCSTCHSAAPKLNVLGEAFRLNGYRFPENDQLLREQPVPLGAEAWKEVWPRAIWPGELPSTPPLALRIVNDVEFTRDETKPYDWTYDFPASIHFLAGGALGGGIGFFTETHWESDGDIEVEQAKIALQDPLPFLPDRSLALWVGKQKPYLLTLGASEIDLAARVPFLWSSVAPSDITLMAPSGEILASDVTLQLGDGQPALEANGLVARRAEWALGVTQGTGDREGDDDDGKDVYWKVRVKLGGLALDGTYDGDEAPVVGRGGQLFDRGVLLEHFGYRGQSAVGEGAEDEREAYGVAARWLLGALDLGAGLVRDEDENPWGLDPPLRMKRWSAFAKAEWFIYPWLLGSLKLETLRASLPDDPPPGFALRADRTRVLPGIVALVHQNVRAVAEAELYTDHEPAESERLNRPHTLWLRLDVAF